jgi:hypothetical protein
MEFFWKKNWRKKSPKQISKQISEIFCEMFFSIFFGYRCSAANLGYACKKKFGGLGPLV